MNRALPPLAIALTLMVAAPALAAPATLALPPGAGLASPSGARLFPRLAGEALPGWLEAWGGAEMQVPYEGFHQQGDLPGGHRLLIVRTQGLLGAYIVQGGRCVGQLLFEPQRLSTPSALASLTRAGFQARPGLVSTADRTYGADATRYERRRAGTIEQYLAVTIPVRQDGRVVPTTYLGAEAYYPASLASALEGVIREGSAALATFMRAEEEKSRETAF